MQHTPFRHIANAVLSIAVCLFVATSAHAENKLMKGLSTLKNATDTLAASQNGNATNATATQNDNAANATASQNASSPASSLSSDEMSGGLKEALNTATAAVVSQLGAEGGFSNDAAIHIPLPGYLGSAQKALKMAGMSSLTDDLELKINRAAEQATPKAKQLFVDAISSMTIDDAANILNGADNAATQYFRGKMESSLASEMKPVIDSALSEVGAIQSYDSLISKYKSLPLATDIKGNLSDYVVGKGMDGIFHYVAEQEAAIRSNPAKQTTELLKKVFGK